MSLVGKTSMRARPPWRIPHPAHALLITLLLAACSRGPKPNPYGLDCVLPEGASESTCAQVAEHQQIHKPALTGARESVLTAQVERVSPPGRWELYAFRDAAPGGVVVPTYEPVLTFTSFSVKPRPDFGFDFVRLGEEAFREARLDTPLVLSRAGTLDAEGDWERFQTALVTEYRYRDEDAAYAALERFSRTKHVVLLASPDPLFERLEVLSRDRGTVHLVPTISPEEIQAIAGDLQRTDSTMTDAEALLYSRRLATREVAKVLFDAVDKVRVPLKDAPSVTAAKVEGNTATVTLSAEPSRPVPLWVKQGYFPNWRNTAGEPVYLAFPTFQLTFTQRRDVTLSFVHDATEWVSGLLSLLGLVGVVAVLLGRRRTPGALSA